MIVDHLRQNQCWRLLRVIERCSARFEHACMHAYISTLGSHQKTRGRGKREDEGEGGEREQEDV